MAQGISFQYSGYKISFQESNGIIKALCEEPIQDRGIYSLDKVNFPCPSNLSLRDKISYLKEKGFGPIILKGQIKWEPPKEEKEIKETSSISNPSPYPAPPKMGVVPPHNAISHLYVNAKNKQQKQACIHYLLHYQHYNAEFTEEECKLLGYPSPLCALPKNPMYVRLDSPLLQIMDKWLEDHVFRHLKNSYIIPKESLFIRLSSSSLGVSVLEILFPDRLFVHDFNEFLNSSSTLPNSKPIILVKITPDKLKKKADEILNEIFGHNNLEELKKTYPKLCFLFLLQIEDIDCLILWGAIRDNSLNYASLEKIFRKEDLSSLLNKIGDVPDRMAVNDFITRGLDNIDLAKALGILGVSPSSLSKSLSIKAITWKELLDIIKRYPFEKDSGSRLYRDSILQWDSCFFGLYPFTKDISSLLVSQIGPWITDKEDVARWAKAYQNLCEIVLFCLQFHHNTFLKIDYQSTALKILDPKNQFSEICKKVGLFSYGMTAFFFALNHVLKRINIKERKPNIACLSQNYFEIIMIIEEMYKKNQITLMDPQPTLLSDLKEIPDILIVDIHPNNASLEETAQNDVGQWIIDKLEKEPSRNLIVILDITLNHLSDPTFKDTIHLLTSLIKAGRLEIFAVQSLAKLVQLGADNFSGGSCLYLGPLSNDPDLIFPPSLPEKATFFSLLTENFKDLTTEYFKKVRENTEWMYLELRKRFSIIKEKIQTKNQVDESSTKNKNYCAAKIKFNGDDNAVYIAIGFKPLFKMLEIESRKEKEAITPQLLKLILKLALDQKLPLTNRQSFGFSLSNMSLAVDTIRFSIGVETRTELEAYANLITDFIYALSYFTARPLENKKHFSWIGNFKNDLIKTYKILKGEKHFPPIEVPLMEDDREEDPQEIGKCTICFEKHRLFLKITNQFIRDDIRIPCLYPGHNWSKSDLMRLFFHIAILKEESDYIVRKRNSDSKTIYSIESKSKDPFYLLNFSKKISDKKSNVKINFEPEFSLEYFENGKDIKKKKDQVYIKQKTGTSPIRLDKMNRSAQRSVFSKCVRFNLSHTNYNEGSVLLEFSEEKKIYNYYEEILNALKKNWLSGVVKFLNGLDYSNLPMAHDNTWNWTKDPLESLCDSLHRLGTYLVYFLSKKIVEEIQTIEHEKCQIAIFTGMIFGLCKDSVENRKLTPEIAQNIASILPNKLFISLHEEIIDRWIDSSNEYVQDHPDQLEGLDLYVTALLPLIKASYSTSATLYDTAHSIPLRYLGISLMHQGLQNHITDLENELPQYVCHNQPKNWQITRYLGLYIRYPLPPAVKSKFIEALKTLSPDIYRRWIKSPEFYYCPIESFDIENIMPEYDEVFYAKDQKNICDFFDKIGCKKILLAQLENKEEISSILLMLSRWAAITSDSDLISRSFEIYESCSWDKEACEDSIRYITYIQKNYIKQNLRSDEETWETMSDFKLQEKKDIKC